MPRTSRLTVVDPVHFVSPLVIRGGVDLADQTGRDAVGGVDVDPRIAEGAVVIGVRRVGIVVENDVAVVGEGPQALLVLDDALERPSVIVAAGRRIYVVEVVAHIFRGRYIIKPKT